MVHCIQKAYCLNAVCCLSLAAPCFYIKLSYIICQILFVQRYFIGSDEAANQSACF